MNDTIRDDNDNQRITPPVLDRVMFRGLLGEIVEKAEPTTEADPIGVYVSLLAGTGALIGPGPHVKIGNTKHPLLIWPLLFGRTGSGRKGEATETAELFLLSSYLDYSELRESGLSSGEGLIELIRDPDGPNDSGGRIDKRLLVFEPEFSSVMARARRDGSTLAAVLREAWAGKALGVLNKKRVRASSSHVVIIGHVTAKEFRLRLADAELAGGTFNRFLPLWIEQSKRLAIPPGMDDQELSHLAKQLGTAIEEAPSGVIDFDPEAAEYWTGEVYDELSAADDEDQAWTEFTRRAPAYCRRIAALTAVLNGDECVTVGDLKAAAALMRYSISTAKYVLDQQTRDPRLDRIRRAIGGAGQQGMSRSEIFGLFSRNLEKAKLDTLLDELVRSGAYEHFEVRGTGRPSERYRLRGTKKEERRRRPPRRRPAA
jgi:Protein of unknown function (DUF3987)